MTSAAKYSCSAEGWSEAQYADSRVYLARRAALVVSLIGLLIEKLIGLTTDCSLELVLVFGCREEVEPGFLVHTLRR